MNAWDQLCGSTGANDPAKCRWCGAYHGPMCPSVKALEFHENGNVKRVEFKTASDYPKLELSDTQPR